MYLSLSLSLGFTRLYLRTASCWRINSPLACVILFSFCRRIRIRFGPILLTRLSSKWIALPRAVIVIWEWNVLCSKRWFSIFFFFASVQAVFRAYGRHCASEGSICFYLRWHLFLHFIHLKHFCYVLFCVAWPVKYQQRLCDWINVLSLCSMICGTGNSLHRLLILDQLPLMETLNWTSFFFFFQNGEDGK